MTNSMIWLNESDTSANLEDWYVNAVNNWTTHHEKQEFGRKVFYKMDPKGDNCPIKLSDLTFAMFSDYLNQLKLKKQRKVLKVR